MDRVEVKIYLDTHCLVWLFYGEPDKFSPAAREAVGENDLIASPLSILELQLLHEIGRMKQTASAIIAALKDEIDLRICHLPYSDIVNHALPENWTRDPFDRLIVANAKAAGAPLVSKDERIRKHYRQAIW